MLKDTLDEKCRVRRSWVALITIALTIGACATEPGRLETPQGTRPGDQFAGYEILGVSDRLSTTLNRTNGYLFVEDVTLNVPVGTQLIIPSLRGWTLAYGSAEPNTTDGHFNGGKWNAEDNHFGLGSVLVSVTDIDAPDLAAGTQTAKIHIQLELRDDNGDDKWLGNIEYSLLYLGPKPAPPPR